MLRLRGFEERHMKASGEQNNLVRKIGKNTRGLEPVRTRGDNRRDLAVMLISRGSAFPTTVPASSHLHHL